VLRNQQLEHSSAKHQWDDGKANACDCRKDPDKKYEKEYSRPEVWWNIYHLVLIAGVKIGIVLPVASSTMFVDFKENLFALWNFNSIRGRCPNEMSALNQLVCLLQVVFVASKRPNFAVIKRRPGLGIAAIEKVGPGLGYDMVSSIQL
jgi:hypothetical protein